MAAGRTSVRQRASYSSRLRQRRGGSGGEAGTPRSLEDVVVGAWAELRSAGTAECPVCLERALHTDGCVDCGSELH